MHTNGIAAIPWVSEGLERNIIVFCVSCPLVWTLIGEVFLEVEGVKIKLMCSVVSIVFYSICQIFNRMTRSLYVTLTNTSLKFVCDAKEKDVMDFNSDTCLGLALSVAFEIAKKKRPGNYGSRIGYREGIHTSVIHFILPTHEYCTFLVSSF